MSIENKTKLVGHGGMNREIAKMTKQGWRVVSTASAHLPGFLYVTYERQRPPSNPAPSRPRREPKDPQAELAKARADLARERENLKNVPAQVKEDWARFGRRLAAMLRRGPGR